MEAKKKTLEEILEREKARRVEAGDYGITACKDHIKEVEMGLLKKDLYSLLKEYVDRANADIFFNKAMILAAWELINEQ